MLSLSIVQEPIVVDCATWSRHRSVQVCVQKPQSGDEAQKEEERKKKHRIILLRTLAMLRSVRRWVRILVSSYVCHASGHLLCFFFFFVASFFSLSLFFFFFFLLLLFGCLIPYSTQVVYKREAHRPVCLPKMPRRGNQKGSQGASHRGPAQTKETCPVVPLHWQRFRRRQRGTKAKTKYGIPVSMCT